jgi:lipoprotein-anchoring transpeptidase ErfK/SrfK
MKLSGMGIAGAAAHKALRARQEFPDSELLGRVCVGKVDLKAQPDSTSATVDSFYEDRVVPWIREVVGYNPYRFIQRYVETPYGFIWAPDLQPVENHPNPEPLLELPQWGAQPGMWTEVTVPYVDLIQANPPARSDWLKNVPYPRFYYQQVFWVDEIQVGPDGEVRYRVNERYGNPGDIFWADARAFRPIPPEEIEQLHPDAGEKRVVVNIEQYKQYLSCYEGGREVYFCRVSAGKEFDIEGKPLGKSSTPTGSHHPWRRMVSLQMSGGASGVGWNLPGVAWTSFITGTGIAIHATFWHNNFGGEYQSHGCINVKPDDAKWIWRWMQPAVPYDPGDRTMQMNEGTIVEVIKD